MLHVWMVHITHAKESCHTCDWAMPHVWLNHGTHATESCHTDEFYVTYTKTRLELAVTSGKECAQSTPSCRTHMWVSHFTPVTESSHTCESVISRMWLNHGTLVTGACHTYECVTPRICTSYVAPKVLTRVWPRVRIEYSHVAKYTQQQRVRLKYLLAPFVATSEGARRTLCQVSVRGELFAIWVF